MSRQTTITGPLAALVEHAGGVGALAEALGVSQMTLWRWGQGRSPVPIVREAVNAWARRRQLPEPFASGSGAAKTG